MLIFQLVWPFIAEILNFYLMKVYGPKHSISIKVYCKLKDSVQEFSLLLPFIAGKDFGHLLFKIIYVKWVFRNIINICV